MVRRHDEEPDIRDDAGDDADTEAKPRKRRTTTRFVNQDEEDVESGMAVATLEPGEEPSAMGQWLLLYEQSMQDLEEGEIVRGRVLKIDDKEVTLYV